MDVAEVTTVASTTFAAIAAIAAAVTAGLSYRQWNAGVTPGLSVDVALYQPSGKLYLTIVNHGGPAKKVSFAVIEGKQAAIGHLPPHGFLASGQAARLLLSMDADAGTQQTAVAYGFDLTGDRVYAFAANGRSGRWRARSRGLLRRRPTDLRAAQILQRFYPDAPDPLTLEPRGSVLVPDETAAERTRRGGGVA